VDGYANQQNGTFIKGTYDYRPADAFTSCSRGCEMFERARTSWYQEPAAVQVSAASHVSFTANTFTNLGQSALGIGNDANATLTGVGLGASDVDVVGNRFMEDGGHAMAVGGALADAHHPSDPRMTNQNILIQNNTVDRVSVDYKDNGGIISTYVTNAQILHNEVSNVPYDGIDTGFGWGTNDAGGSNDYLDRDYYNWNPLYTTPTTLKNNVVEGNLVHNTKAHFADGGSLYNLSASPGAEVDKNYLFNISGVGLYLDEGSRSMTYENNVVQGGSFVFTNAYSLRSNTSDNLIQNNWYNSGGASAPNATAHNNMLVNKIKVNGANAGAVDSQFGPITAGPHERAPDRRLRRSRALSARGGGVKDSNLRSFRDGFTVPRPQTCDQRRRLTRNNFRAYSPRTADVSRGRPDNTECLHSPVAVRGRSPPPDHVSRKANVLATTVIGTSFDMRGRQICAQSSTVSTSSQ